MAEKEKGAAVAVPEVETIDVAEGELGVEGGNATIRLAKPLDDGRETLVLDFDKINGHALIACEKQARKLDPSITVMMTSQVYQALVGARAAGLKYDEALGLAGKDFTTLCVRALGFLAPQG